MPKLTQHNDVLQVLSDGQEEWLLLLPDGSAKATVASDEILLVSDRHQILFYDIPKRSLVAAVDVSAGSKAMCISADRTRLYVIHTCRDESKVHTDLLTVALPTGSILASQRLQGVLGVRDIREAPDGHLVVSRSNSNAEDPSVLWHIDPDNGAVERSEVANSTTFQPFEQPSPDGRYWLRRDDRLARQVVQDGKEGIFGRRSTTYYSPVVQLWETWPPRFLRWLPVGWTPEDEMPRLDGGWQIHDPAEKARVWISVADASEQAPNDPTIGIIWPEPGLREQLAAEAYSRIPRPDPTEREKVQNETIVKMIREWREFAHGDPVHRRPFWDLDGTGFWLQVQQVLRRISVDGTTSAGQYALRRGGMREVLASGSETLPGHRFAAKFNQASAIFHDVGRGPARPTEINREGPDWSDRGGTYDTDLALPARAEKLRATRDRILVPLDAWTDAGVMAAMRALGDTLTTTPPPRGRPQAWVVFSHKGKEISEKQFFERVALDFQGMAPEIDRLINVACDALASHQMLLSQDFQVALLGHAARALGLLDIGSLSTIKRYYSEMIDSGHETWFTMQTVPAIVEHHGWQRVIIEFVWWLMLQRPTNGLDSYDRVWLSKGRPHDGWGMGDAVKGLFTPGQFAELTRVIGGQPQISGAHPARYSYQGVDDLVQHIGFRHDQKVEKVRQSDPWVAEFIDLMDSSEANT